MTLDAIHLDHLSFSYPGGQSVLENLTLRVAPGELVAIIGPNGGGKSTLIKILVGLLHGYSGAATIFGRTPREAQRAGLIGYVPQRSDAERAFPVSARQAVLMSPCRNLPGWSATPRKLKDRAQRSLELVGAAEYADEPVGSLSGGQWQRVMIARALTIEPKVLALDEPLVGVDAAGQRLFASLLRTLHRDLGLTILLVTHDLRTVAGASAECDRIACLRRTLHFHAAPKGVTPQVLAEVFQHDLADIFGDVHIDAHRAVECAHDHPAPKGAGE
ncbi:MAG: metal ABC transporter ATP-binding protein [Phycisphaerae bacterium]|nr:metal ABC transporter ATP-binding protein [Phycisphaerae bacterium]